MVVGKLGARKRSHYVEAFCLRVLILQAVRSRYLVSSCCMNIEQGSGSGYEVPEWYVLDSCRRLVNRAIFHFPKCPSFAGAPGSPDFLKSLVTQVAA
jgi:hypothetical protein